MGESEAGLQNFDPAQVDDELSALFFHFLPSQFIKDDAVLIEQMNSGTAILNVVIFLNSSSSS